MISSFQKKTDEAIDAFLPKWKDAGLWGIEVCIPYTPNDLVTEYLKLAKKYDLEVTGGSNFHGGVSRIIFGVN